MRPTPVEPTFQTRRWLFVTVVGALFAWVGWQIIANTMSDSRVLNEPEAALSWRSDSAPALVVLGEKRLTEANSGDDLLDVAQLAERAISLAPLEQRAIRLLGFVASSQNSPGADGLMEVAGRRAGRDALTQLWLFDRQSKAGNAAGMLAHADLTLRARPDLRERLFPVIAGLAAQADTRPLLVSRLAMEPPWREAFLTELAHAAIPSSTYATLRALASGPTPPTEREIGAYIDQLVSGEQYELAYLAWASFRRAGEQLDYAFNGGFDSPNTGSVFDWRVNNVRGAATDIVSDARGGGALRVTFSSTRVPYGHIAKLLILPPGTFQLTGIEKAQELANERGMTWRIRCADDQNQILTATTLLHGTSDWRSFATSFEVPFVGCPGQWLRLELDARVASEQQVSGEVWYDDLKVSRLVED